MQKFLFAIVVLLATPAFAADAEFLVGGDISSLPDLEKAGAIYSDHDKPDDALRILRDHGCNLFRVRLFVKPNHDATRNFGPTQDLPMILTLSKRIKESGAKLSLALHYSDTWADPANQQKPAAWKDLSFVDLESKVTAYTNEVLTAMKANGTPPDIVEVGNETTNGMLWPDGKLDGATPRSQTETWNKYARLFAAGSSAVRKALPEARIVLHISAGGKAGTPAWFFKNIEKQNADFDIIGLSFYPTWSDSMEGLKQNLSELQPFKKDILIIETAYPYLPGKMTPEMSWPRTPEGQKQFLKALVDTAKSAPDHRGIGVVWWYPEALPIKNHNTWEGGSLGLFDQTGNLLPTIDAFCESK